MSRIKRQSLAILLIILAVGFMVLGLYRGEIAEVFLKSTNICLECIGIG